MKVIIENSTAEIVEKKSRFIANVFYVESVEDAESKLNEIRKKYYDAKHNCYAYILGQGGDIVKASDDGEPQGTAGRPMLDILRGEELTNCIAIVTRYFGGVLLGTGGLVRAYSDSLKKAISMAKISDIYNGKEIAIKLLYDDYAKVEKIVDKYNQNAGVSREITNGAIRHNSINFLDREYDDKVTVKILINDDIYDRFSAEIKNITNGKVILEKPDKRIYYFKGTKILMI